MITGDERPKQFCSLLGSETLLERTRRRAGLLIRPAQMLVSLTRGHEPFYRPLLGDMPAHCAVIQPDDRGTAPAIVYGVMRIAAMAPMATVAIFPSDHYIDDDRRFMEQVAGAFTALERRPDLVALLGIAPETAEVEYGWIEPAEKIAATPLFRVRRFWEKPPTEVAQALFARRCLWNSFVMVARIPTLLALIRHAAPALHGAFASIGAVLGTSAERSDIGRIYARIPSSGFSEAVLASRSSNLAVLPVSGVQWSDWGQPARVLATLAGLGAHPDWLERLASTA
jgi:mannose-1-phosphate guanylyltransferase